MSYTVTWKRSAKARLTQIWLDSPDRNAVALAANTVDSLLRREPLGHGESRGDNLRILIHRPLAVVYEVREADRIVEVLTVRYTPSV